jgi:hypothetical protein
VGADTSIAAGFGRGFVFGETAAEDVCDEGLTSPAAKKVSIAAPSEPSEPITGRFSSDSGNVLLKTWNRAGKSRLI